MMKTVLIVLLVSSVVGGCVSNRPRRGSIAGPEIGRRFLDFGFLDERGRASFLGQLLGDYTVLAFTRPKTDAHRPVVDLLESIVAENSEAGSVRVVGVDVYSPEAGCQQHAVCYLVETRPDQYLRRSGGDPPDVRCRSRGSRVLDRARSKDARSVTGTGSREISRPVEHRSGHLRRDEGT